MSKKLAPQRLEEIKTKEYGDARGSGCCSFSRNKVKQLFDHIAAQDEEIAELRSCPNESWECAKYQRELEKERDSLKAEIAEMKFELDHRRSTLKEDEQEYTKMALERDSLKTEIVLLKKEIAGLQHEIVVEQQETVAEHQAAVDMFCQWDDLRDEFATVAVKLEKANVREVKLRRIIEHSRQTFEALNMKDDQANIVLCLEAIEELDKNDSTG